MSVSSATWKKLLPHSSVQVEDREICRGNRKLLLHSSVELENGKVGLVEKEIAPAWPGLLYFTYKCGL